MTRSSIDNPPLTPTVMNRWSRTFRTLRGAIRVLWKSPGGILKDVEKYLARRVFSPAERPISHLPAPDDLPQCQPLNLRICAGLKPTLNLLIPGLRLSVLSGGPNTALNLAYRLAAAGLPIRILSTDLSVEADHQLIWQHLQSLTGIHRRLPNVQLVSAHDRGRPVLIGTNDQFLATAWWTVHQIRHALDQLSSPKFFYLIQDYEPALYPWSTNAALAEATYALDHQPIFCSRLLADYFREQRVGRFADPEFVKSSLSFEPAVDEALFTPPARLNTSSLESHPAGQTKRKLLFYARPGAPRNLYEMGLVALRRAVDRGLFAAHEWELWFMGDDLPPVDLGEGQIIRQAPWAGYTQYAELLQTADVGLSLMLSPHTSYPPLELAACGASVVTNTYSVKTASRLRAISTNLISVPADVDAVTAGLHEAVLRVDQIPLRRAGAKLNLPRHWDDSFAQLIPQIMRLWAQQCQQTDPLVPPVSHAAGSIAA